MAYTQTDLNAVEQAIIALASGERVVGVKTMGRELVRSTALVHQAP